MMMIKKILIIITLTIFCFISVLIFGVYLIDRHSQNSRINNQITVPTMYDFWAGGCFIQNSNGRWINVCGCYPVKLKK